MSFLTLLRDVRAKAAAESADPWRLRLERVRGNIGADGVERVSTQALFDLLEVPQPSRTTGACRRLAKLMQDLGWTRIKARGLNRSGYREHVRGYARDRRRASAF